MQRIEFAGRPEAGSDNDWVMDSMAAPEDRHIWGIWSGADAIHGDQSFEWEIYLSLGAAIGTPYNNPELVSTLGTHQAAHDEHSEKVAELFMQVEDNGADGGSNAISEITMGPLPHPIHWEERETLFWSAWAGPSSENIQHDIDTLVYYTEA
jgi:hypothetical protein